MRAQSSYVLIKASIVQLIRWTAYSIQEEGGKEGGANKKRKKKIWGDEDQIP